jgi:flagellar basal body rod protein FlgG
MINGINSGLSALRAIQTKVDSAANNTANINSDGYKKTRVTLYEDQTQGVTANISKVETPGPLVYEKTTEGQTLIEKSNVELAEELPNLILSQRAMQANIKTIQTQDEMAGYLIDIKS